MTAAATTGGAWRGRLSVFSATWFGNKLVNFAFGGWFLGKIFMGIATILLLGAADTIVGGVVLTDMVGDNSLYEKLAWAGSFATSGIQIGLMGYAMHRKGVALILVVPAVLLGLADVWNDSRLPTLILFGHDAVVTTWFIPEGVNPGWWGLHIFTLLSAFGEIGIGFMFGWMMMEIKKARSGALATP